MKPLGPTRLRFTSRSNSSAEEVRAAISPIAPAEARPHWERKQLRTSSKGRVLSTWIRTPVKLCVCRVAVGISQAPLQGYDAQPTAYGAEIFVVITTGLRSCRGESRA